MQMSKAPRCAGRDAIARCAFALIMAACGSDPGPAAVDAKTDATADTVAQAMPDASADATALPGAATISFEHEGRTTSFRGDQDIVATCAGGHRGIEAERQGERFALNVFVARPGLYRCDDPGPFILLQFTTRDPHAEYGVSAVEPGGSCLVRVTTVRPRLAGVFEATLPRRAGAGPAELELRRGRFDVPFPLSPECP
jgi:hypothetical protein